MTTGHNQPYELECNECGKPFNDYKNRDSIMVTGNCLTCEINLQQEAAVQEAAAMRNDSNEYLQR